MKTLMAVCIIIFCIPVLGISEEFTIPHKFEPGDEIKAQQFKDNYDVIEDEINTLKRELDSIKSEMASIPSPSIVHTKSWNLEKREDGAATDWANLPTEMALPITTGKSALFITADISRINHSQSGVNTEFQIIVVNNKSGYEGKVAKTSTGNRYKEAFGPLTLHGVTEVEPGAYTVRVQYKTQKGFVAWKSEQFRRLTVLEVPLSEVKPSSE